MDDKNGKSCSIKDFIQRYVRENTARPLEIDLALFITQLKTFCDSSRDKIVTPIPKVQNGNGNGKESVPIAKAYYTKLVNESKAYNKLKRKAADDHGKYEENRNEN